MTKNRVQHDVLTVLTVTLNLFQGPHQTEDSKKYYLYLKRPGITYKRKRRNLAGDFGNDDRTNVKGIFPGKDPNSMDPQILHAFIACRKQVVLCEKCEVITYPLGTCHHNSRMCREFAIYQSVSRPEGNITF